jgi:beta-mannosidase
MKDMILLNKGWEIKQVAPAPRVRPDGVGEDTWIEARRFPAQVHDILYDHKLIPEEYRVGWCQGTIWTDDLDWLYRCSFAGRAGVSARLVFKGIDTIADIYLNGELVATHDDFFVSEVVDVSKKLKAENVLLLHFHNVKGALASMTMPPGWDNQMLKCKLIRKPVHDFIPEGVTAGSEYQGSNPSFTPVGIFRDVLLVYPGQREIEQSDLRAFLSDSGQGVVSFEASGHGEAAGLEVKLLVIDQDGRTYSCAAPCAPAGDGTFRCSLALALNNPLLWWPRGMGPQSLYAVEASLCKDGEVLDCVKKHVGFRRVENPSSLEFLVNGKRVRLWGGSMDPLQGYSHCWEPDRGRRLFTLVENANMNTLRIWGEGIPLPDCFYEEADARGILIWQEFFLGHCNCPDSSAYKAKYLKEARELILRLRHHASLLMWCGGNETIMGAEHELKRKIGHEVLLEEFPKLLKELDPGRYYHPSSPSGGAWANDPREGDYHTYNCVLEYPYQAYPNFTSECIRTAPPVKHSLRQFIKGELWPQGYDGKFRHEDTFPFPANWAVRTCHRVRGEIKTGPFWEFYDADNEDQLIYRFAAAYGKDLRKELERIRMGSRDGGVHPSRRSKGFLSCKLLDTWPKVYCAVIDFFQEGFIPYYTTLRGMQPLLLCFDLQDSIRLWLCNDSGDSFSGRVKLGLYSLTSEKLIADEDITVSMGQGESGIIRDLAGLRYFFPKETLLTAQLFDASGNLMTYSVDYVTEERRLKFPDASLKAHVRDGELSITTDCFARCVEILGERDGNPFGWLFSDNYFDLLPGMTRKVRVVDGPDRGTISLKPHYSNGAVTVQYRR